MLSTFCGRINAQDLSEVSTTFELLLRVFYCTDSVLTTKYSVILYRHFRPFTKDGGLVLRSEQPANHTRIEPVESTPHAHIPFLRLCKIVSFLHVSD